MAEYLGCCLNNNLSGESMAMKSLTKINTFSYKINTLSYISYIDRMSF